MVAIIKDQDVAKLTEEALIGDWTRLVAIDKALGKPTTAEEEETLVAVLERVEEVETALLAQRAESQEGVQARLRIIARAIEGGADAAHVVSLFDRCRADLIDHRAVSLA